MRTWQRCERIGTVKVKGLHKYTPQDIVQLQDVAFPIYDEVFGPEILGELLAASHII